MFILSGRRTKIWAEVDSSQKKIKRYPLVNSFSQFINTNIIMVTTGPGLLNSVHPTDGLIDAVGSTLTSSALLDQSSPCKNYITQLFEKRETQRIPRFCEKMNQCAKYHQQQVFSFSGRDCDRSCGGV